MRGRVALGIAAIISLTSASSQASFCDDIDQLITVSQHQFDTILGNRQGKDGRKIRPDYPLNYYKSLYVIPGATQCQISEPKGRHDHRPKRRLSCEFNYKKDYLTGVNAFNNLVAGLKECGNFGSFEESNVPPAQTVFAWRDHEGTKTYLQLDFIYQDGYAFMGMDVWTW